MFGKRIDHICWVKREVEALAIVLQVCASHERTSCQDDSDPHFITARASYHKHLPPFFIFVRRVHPLNLLNLSMPIRRMTV
jgi:hypothetical protein